MSLDVALIATRPIEVYSANITHNLVRMAERAGIYDCMWRPEESGIKTAADLIPLLRAGLAALEAAPEQFTPLNPENGWGCYDGLLLFVRNYLRACETDPDATVEASR